MPLAAGTKLGSYEIADQIGAGGMMGEVCGITSAESEASPYGLSINMGGAIAAIRPDNDSKRHSLARNVQRKSPMSTRFWQIALRMLLWLGLTPALSWGTDLTITMTANSSGTVLTGQGISYTIVVLNDSTTGGGPFDSPNTVVTVTLPLNLTFESWISTEGTCGFNGNTLTCDLDTLPAFTGAGIRLLARANSTGIVSSVAEISGALPDPDPGNNTAIVVVSIIDTCSSSCSFSVPDRGGTSTTSQGTAGTTTLGYGRIRPDAGMTTPSGLAIFGFTQNGVLVTEASIPAAAPIQGGRIFAEVNGPVNTGLAIANPNDVSATISFFFTDTSGTNFGSGTLTLGANQQTAKFLHEDPFNGVAPVLGTFTFTSSVPISVVALRGFTNERSDFLITTLPVAPLSSSSTATIYFPHFADGGGWATQVILVNPTDSTITGNIRFFGQGSGTTAATLVNLTLVGTAIESSYSYSISPRSSQRFTTSNPASVSVGSVRVTPDVGSTSPSGLGIFSFTTGGITVSEAGIPALPEGSAFRVYVEASGTPGQVGAVQSGLAITDTSGTSNSVTLEVTNLDGSTVGAAVILSLPPSGQVAKFLDELVTLPANFSGVLRVTSTSDVAIVGLRARVNQRGDFMITTTSPTNEVAAPTSVDTYFPHLADSGGWSTQFVLFSGTAGQTSSGTLSFVDQAGEPLDLILGP